MTTSLLHPKGGVRVLLERATASDSGADYRGALYLPSDRIDYRVRIAGDGAVTLSPTEREAAPKLVELLRQMCKRVWRDAKGTPMRWPERVLVWRPTDGASDGD